MQSEKGQSGSDGDSGASSGNDHIRMFGNGRADRRRSGRGIHTDDSYRRFFNRNSER